MQEIDFKQDFKDYEEAWKFLKKSIETDYYVAIDIGYYRKDMSYIDRIDRKSWENSTAHCNRLSEIQSVLRKSKLLTPLAIDTASNKNKAKLIWNSKSNRKPRQIWNALSTL